MTDHQGLPKGARIGDTITFVDSKVGTLPHLCQRTGIIIDRAANGVRNDWSTNGSAEELPGYWLWVMPDTPHATDTRNAVRVRTWGSGRNKGRFIRDDGPMWQRSSTGFGRVVAA